jgi:hypothetical protein
VSRAARLASLAVYRSLMPRDTVLHATSEEERAESLAHFPKQTAAFITDVVIIPPEVQHAPGDGMVRLGYIGRLEMGRRGRKWMIDDFSWDRLALSMYEVYRPLVSQRDGATEVRPVHGSQPRYRRHRDRRQRSHREQQVRN